MGRKENNRRWYCKTRLIRLQKAKEKYRNNKEKHLQGCRLWQSKNKERIKIKRKIYLERNREKINEKARERRSKNLDSYRKAGRDRYAREKERISERRKMKSENKKIQSLLDLRAIQRKWEYQKMWAEYGKILEDNRRANLHWANSKNGYSPKIPIYYASNDNPFAV